MAGPSLGGSFAEVGAMAGKVEGHMGANDHLFDDIPLLNRSEALSRIDEDEELYLEIYVLFQEDTPRQIEAMRQSFAADNLAQVGRVAHSIKSAAANVGANRLAVLCHEVETAVLGGNRERLEMLVPLLAETMALLMESPTTATR